MNLYGSYKIGMAFIMNWYRRYEIGMVFILIRTVVMKPVAKIYCVLQCMVLLLVFH